MRGDVNTDETVRAAAQALGFAASPDWATLGYQGYGAGTPLTQAKLEQTVATYIKRCGGQAPCGLLILVHRGNNQAPAKDPSPAGGNGDGPGGELHLTIAGCQVAIVDAAGFTSPRLHPGDVLIHPPVHLGGNGAVKEQN